MAAHVADRDPTPAQQRISFVVLIALAAATAGIAFTSLLPARESVHTTRNAIEQRQEQNEALQLQVDELREEILLQETDAWTTLRILRDEHGLGEPGEIKVE